MTKPADINFSLPKNNALEALPDHLFMRGIELCFPALDSYPLFLSRFIFLIHTLSPCSLVIPGYKYFFLLLLSLLLCFYSYSLPVKILPLSSLSLYPCSYDGLSCLIPYYIILFRFCLFFFAIPFVCQRRKKRTLNLGIPAKITVQRRMACSSLFHTFTP